MRRYNPAVLVRLMAQRQLTTADLAALVGVSRRAVQWWRKGAVTPSAEALARVAEALKVKQERFFTRRMA